MSVPYVQHFVCWTSSSKSTSIGFYFFPALPIFCALCLVTEITTQTHTHTIILYLQPERKVLLILFSMSSKLQLNDRYIRSMHGAVCSAHTDIDLLVGNFKGAQLATMSTSMTTTAAAERERRASWTSSSMKSKINRVQFSQRHYDTKFQFYRYSLALFEQPLDMSFSRFFLVHSKCSWFCCARSGWTGWKLTTCFVTLTHTHTRESTTVQCTLDCYSKNITIVAVCDILHKRYCI